MDTLCASVYFSVRIVFTAEGCSVPCVLSETQDHARFLCFTFAASEPERTVSALENSVYCQICGADQVFADNFVRLCLWQFLYALGDVLGEHIIFADPYIALVVGDECVPHPDEADGSAIKSTDSPRFFRRTF